MLAYPAIEYFFSRLFACSSVQNSLVDSACHAAHSVSFQMIYSSGGLLIKPPVSGGGHGWLRGVPGRQDRGEGANTQGSKFIRPAFRLLSN